MRGLRGNKKQIAGDFSKGELVSLIICNLEEPYASINLSKSVVVSGWRSWGGGGDERVGR